MQNKKLTDLQLELLNMFSFEVSKEDLLAVKCLLADYFSEKLLQNVSNAIVEKNIVDADFKRWINE